MDHQGRSMPEHRSLPDNATHADILKAVEGCRKDIGVILMDIQGVKTQIHNLAKVLGEETEDEQGNAKGTGLVGRHMRLSARVDKRFRSYDDWRNYAVGAVTAAGLLIAALWWIVQDRLAAVLK